MKISKNKVVALSYELEVEGQIADKAEADRPLDYIHGTGMLLPKFEGELEGKQEGDSFDFILSAEEGYGEYHSEYKFDIPKESFADQDGRIREDLLQVGFIIPMLNTSGQVVQGKVAAIHEDSVTMDFNHPMAGKTLHFTGKVESVREATEKELTEGLHGEFVPREGCSKCHGGCHGDCEGGCEGECEGEGNCHEEGTCKCHKN